jgi:hypothetical protein
MSQENVELIRAAIEDFIAGKSEFDAEGMLTRIAGEEIYDSEIECSGASSSQPGVEVVKDRAPQRLAGVGEAPNP